MNLHYLDMPSGWGYVGLRFLLVVQGPSFRIPKPIPWSFWCFWGFRVAMLVFLSMVELEVWGILGFDVVLSCGGWCAVSKSVWVGGVRPLPMDPNLRRKALNQSTLRCPINLLDCAPASSAFVILAPHISYSTAWPTSHFKKAPMLLFLMHDHFLMEESIRGILGFSMC